MRDAVTAYVALGGNLGDPVAAIRHALMRIGELPGTELISESSMYQTAPVDSTGPDYINAVAHISTRLAAPDLLSRLQDIEQSAGRARSSRNAPRTLDLDLLLFGSARIDSERLIVPHPRMNQRAFVLVPLAEIAPQLVLPSLLAAVADQPIQRLQGVTLPAR